MLARIIVDTADASLVELPGGDTVWLAAGAFVRDGGHAVVPDGMAGNRAPADPGTQLRRLLTLSGGIAITPKPNRPHQAEAFAKLHDLRCFALHMQMRGGKTKVAIDLLCNHHANGHIGHVLWCCPLSVVATARQQWMRWRSTDVPVDFAPLETLSQCGPERLAALTAGMTERSAIIIDESHMVKNGLTRRHKRLRPLCNKAVVRGLLTGTPITNNVQDIYDQMRLLDWRILGYTSYWRFCEAHLVMSDKYPGLIRGTRNLGTLHERMAPYTYEWSHDYSDQQEYATRWLTMTDEQQEWYDSIKRAVIDRLQQMTEQSHDIYLLFTALASVLSGHLSARLLSAIYQRPRTSPAIFDTPKHQAALEWVAAQGSHALVWCARRHELDRLAADLPDAVIIHGGIAPVERHARITRFRERGGVLLAMMQVARRGIELYECDDVLYYSQTFDYEARAQSEMRTLLPSPDSHCRYTDLLINDSIDERMRDAVDSKEHIARRFAQLFRDDRARALSELESL